MIKNWSFYNGVWGGGLWGDEDSRRKMGEGDVWESF